MDLFSNQLMNHHRIGQLLQARYQIVQSLGEGVFGQTYIAVNRDDPKNPQCVIKNLKSNRFPPGYLDTLTDCLGNKTADLHLLGSHSQISQLITCFEENEQFYLVEEFVEGHSLSAELPLNQYWQCNWTEREVIEFLEEVLGILEFIHSQGIIHGHITPENLIRRTVDGKLVLTDFACIQSTHLGLNGELPLYDIPIKLLGYLPPEQFIGQTQPNIDIYALGMIAIQALTGLEPVQLQLYPKTNQIIWRNPDISVNDHLAAVLNCMIHYDCQERFYSAGEVLHVIKEIFGESKIQFFTETIHPLSQTKIIERDNTHQQFNTRQLPPLITGMKVGLAANSLLMGLGVYSIMNNCPAYSETETLHKATQEYQTGDLHKALALAQSIPAYSNVYPEAQATIEVWQEQWQLAAKQYQIAEQALNEGRWCDVLDIAPTVPNILYWQSKINQLVQQAQTNIETQTHHLLTKAYAKATAREFSSAIEYLRQIPPKSSAGALVKEKLTEYHQKRQTRAAYFLQKANIKASMGDFNEAVNLLRKIPKNTSVYTQAQITLNKYIQKLQIQKQSKNLALDPPTSNHKYFHPENDLLEVNIR